MRVKGLASVRRLALLALPALLAACQVPAPSASGVPGQTRQTASAPTFAPATVQAQPPAAARPPALPSAASALDRRLAELGSGFHGDVGIAVRDVQTGWSSDYRGLDYFPQQSVSKLWVALTALDAVDRGALSLDTPVTVGREDLTLFHQPIRALVLKPGGFHTTVGALLTTALTQSDNSANQAVLNQVGGPEAVRAALARRGLLGIRFGPGERLLQSQIAGLEWKQDFAIGDGFYTARDALPESVRRAAFDAYVANPIDGAQPLAMVDALARLKSGNLISADSGTRLLSILSQTKTGPQRLKGALPADWTLSHKTGTGQIFEGEQAGYNDVGVLTAPDGRAYAVAVMIGRTATPLEDRMTLMQRVVAAVVDYDAKLRAQEASGDGAPTVVAPH